MVALLRFLFSFKLKRREKNNRQDNDEHIIDRTEVTKRCQRIREVYLRGS